MIQSVLKKTMFKENLQILDLDLFMVSIPLS